MSFSMGEGNRVFYGEITYAESQLSSKFITFQVSMSEQEYDQYTKDLITESTDYWFSAVISGTAPNYYEFGFMSDIDAMGFRLRWE